MKFQTQHSSKPRNKNLEGAVFLDADSHKIYGLISLDGADRKVRAIVDMEGNTPFIRGGVDFEHRSYDLELRSVPVSGHQSNQPSWQGYLANRTDRQDRFHLAGWINTSTGSGIRYLRLKAEPVGLSRDRSQKIVLDAWSVLTGRDQSQIRLF